MYNVSIVLLYKQVYNVITVKETDSRKAERIRAMGIHEAIERVRELVYWDHSTFYYI